MSTCVRNMPPTNRSVVAIAYDQMCTFELAIAVEVFGLLRPELGADCYRFAIASADGPRLRATGGLELKIAGGLELAARAGTIVLPGWRTPGDVPLALRRVLRNAHRRGARILTICSGVFALAATGLLDGKRATTHWMYIDELVARHPQIRVERDVLYVDEGSLLTSAGSAAGIDLCLHLVRRDFGPKVANTIARRMVIAPHRDGGQLQYVEAPIPTLHEGPQLSSLLDRITKHLDRPLEVAALAREVGMSPRTFFRRFAATTGMTPASWIAHQRVRRARELLEGTTASIERIAEACGFVDASALRRQFRARLGTSPVAYRSRFGRPRARPTGRSSRRAPARTIRDGKT